jgi:CBS domain-containing protein
MPISGAMPLAALDAVAIDTETTGLDTSSARIVQIAGMAIALGRVVEGESFATLVAPGMAIPRSSTAIHGIDDAAVDGAPAFAEAVQGLNDFVGDRLLLGYSIGFDLAVLEHETKRAGMVWYKPRSLCVRMLGAIVNPRLPEESLDALAGWLGVPISGRHSALGDARAAAHVFTALVPHLAGKGIRTLAEAERAVMAMTQRLEEGHRAGWAEPATRPDIAAATGSVDPYAYRHRVGDLMTTRLEIVAASTPTLAAIELMAARKISSLFVSQTAEAGGMLADYAIITERDVLRQLAVHGAGVLSVPVGDFASRPLASIAAHAFVYRAIGRMERMKIRHLAVRDRDERLAGVISARDLLRLRAGVAVQLDDTIGAARTAEEMARAWATLPAVANALAVEEIDARIVSAIVSEEIRVMTRRAAELAEDAMAQEGKGGAPCPYALMVLGSGGRGESLLAADQDNAIVFAHGEPGGPEDAWFADLGTRIAHTLDAAGIPYCTGGIMGRNAEWRGSVNQWHRRIAGWVGQSRPDDLLNVDIVFDMRPVHGSLALGADLFEHAFATASGQPVFAKLMGEKLFQTPSPFTFLGGVQTTDGRIDLKRFGLFPIVTAARALAIRHDVRRHSTRGRLEGLAARGIGNVDEIARLIEAHRLFVTLMLEQQGRDLETGIRVSNKVEVAPLPRAVQADLKTALRAAQTVPDMVRGLMF